jgi:hypothetical protein
MGSENYARQPLIAPGAAVRTQRPGYAEPGEPGRPGQPGMPGHAAAERPAQERPAQEQPAQEQPAPPGFVVPGGPREPLSGAPQGLAIAALVSSIVALVLCLFPAVNIFALPAGVSGLGLGAAALVLASKRRTRTGMPMAALIVSALAVVGFMVAQVLHTGLLAGVEESAGQGAGGAGGAVPEQRQAAGPALSLGDSAAVGRDYKVTVESVNLDATPEVMNVTEFNEAPKGQYVLVDLSVEYTGPEEGDPWLDLSVKLSGADARQYDAQNCRAVLEKAVVLVPTLENGGQGDYQVCMDIPAEAASDAELFVQPRRSLKGESRVYWSVPEEPEASQS